MEHRNRARYDRSRLRYPSDLTDAGVSSDQAADPACQAHKVEHQAPGGVVSEAERQQQRDDEARREWQVEGGTARREPERRAAERQDPEQRRQADCVLAETRAADVQGAGERVARPDMDEVGDRHGVAEGLDPGVRSEPRRRQVDDQERHEPEHEKGERQAEDRAREEAERRTQGGGPAREMSQDRDPREQAREPEHVERGERPDGDEEGRQARLDRGRSRPAGAHAGSRAPKQNAQHGRQVGGEELLVRLLEMDAVRQGRRPPPRAGRTDAAGRAPRARGRRGRRSPPLETARPPSSDARRTSAPSRRNAAMKRPNRR